MVVTSEANLERSIAEKEACIEAVEDVLSKMKELAAELQRNLQQQNSAARTGIYKPVFVLGAHCCYCSVHGA